MSFFKESFSTGSPFLLKILTIFQWSEKRGEVRARERSWFRNNGYGKVMTGRSQLSKGPRGLRAPPAQWRANCRIFPQLAHVGNSAQWVTACVVVQTDIVMKASPSTAHVERSFFTMNAIIIIIKC